MEEAGSRAAVEGRQVMGWGKASGWAVGMVRLLLALEKLLGRR